MDSSPWTLLMIVALFSIFQGRELVVAQDTSFVFDYFDCLRDEHIQCTGDSSSTGEGWLNLTGSWMGSVGRVLYLPRIRLLDPATSKVSSFSTNFTFSTQGGYPNPGEGLAFVLLSNPSYVGSGGGFLGIYGQDGNAGTPTLAVEFDTFKNGRSGHFRFDDINDNHVGLDLESIKSKVQVDAGSNGIVFNKVSKVTGWVDYHAPTGILQVRISRDSSRPAAPLLSYGSDLSKIFAEYMYVGFSAATGKSCFSFHTVLDWGFSSWSIPPDTLPPSSLPPPPRNPIVPISAPAPSPFTPPSLNPPRSPIGVPPINNARPPLSPIVPISAPAPNPFSPPSLNPPRSPTGVPPTNNVPPPGGPILPPTTNAPPPRAPVEGPGSPHSNPGPGVPPSPDPSSPGPAPPTLVPVPGPSSNGTGPGLPTPPPQNDHLPPSPSSTSAPGPVSNSTPPSGPGGSIPPTPGSPDDDTTIRVVVPVVASLGALAALFACCLLFACCRKRKHEDLAGSS